uniref:Uncharacterized protein n=1 Tax=Panagrolaimus superbus TaxID=310955 RepID=A0A914YBY5_9BILA
MSGRRSILQFRARHCFTAFIGVHCFIILLTGIAGFGDISEVYNLSYEKCTLNFTRIPWISTAAIVFFSVAFIELFFLLFYVGIFEEFFIKSLYLKILHSIQLLNTLIHLVKQLYQITPILTMIFLYHQCLSF